MVGNLVGKEDWGVSVVFRNWVILVKCRLRVFFFFIDGSGVLVILKLVFSFWWSG